MVRWTVVALHPAARCSIRYDDGDEWSGPLAYVYTLRAQSDDEDDAGEADEEAARRPARATCVYPAAAAVGGPPLPVVVMGRRVS